MTHQYPSPSQPLSDEERALAAGYVLGDLNDQEQQQVATLLKERPAMQQEVQALSVSLRSLPQGLPPITPPPALEAKILNAYAATYSAQTQRINTPTIQPQKKSAKSAKSVVNAPTPQRSNANDALRRSPKASYATPKSKIQNPKSKTQNSKSQIPWSKIIAGIATLAALILGASNARLRYQLAQMADPAENPDTQRVAEILQQPNSRLVSLQGRDETNTANAGGTLLFQKGQWQEVVVSLNNLPPLPVDQVYRMWLTLENGTVLFCGEFNTEADGTVQVRLAPPELPPQGVKTTGLFVTQNASSDALDADGLPIMVGEI